MRSMATPSRSSGCADTLPAPASRDFHLPSDSASVMLSAQPLEQEVLMPEAYEAQSPCPECHREMPRYGQRGQGVFPDKEVWSRYICLERPEGDSHPRCPVCGLCNDPIHVGGRDREDLPRDRRR